MSIMHEMTGLNVFCFQSELFRDSLILFPVIVFLENSFPITKPADALTAYYSLYAC